jgi:tetratricopeptide (TPR) repeat protein
VGDRLRPLWDFADLDATEERFQELLKHVTTDSARAEVLTQLARVEGLRGRFDEGERLIEEAEEIAGASPAAQSRVRLERGRLLRSGGDPAGALPLFESAFKIAAGAPVMFLAADAAHMAALATPDRDLARSWTQRGIEVAEGSADPYWLGPLLNNLGWDQYGAGEFEAAFDSFERALHARERDPENRVEIEIARYAVAKTLRALGRADEAAPMLEAAVAWTQTENAPDGWFHEELAEIYAALDRPSDAREQGSLALPLLRKSDPSFDEDVERAARMRQFAGLELEGDYRRRN